jgi:hypothetical protein
VARQRDPLDDAELIGSYGDYDEASPEGDLDRHCILAPPWLERRRDGSTERYLPVSPRTLQPAPYRRVRNEWERLVHGIRGRKTGGAGPGLWDFDAEAELNPRLARLRAGLAYQRHDAPHMARWMDGHGAQVDERSNRVYSLFFLQGVRRRAIARKLVVGWREVDRLLAGLRRQAGAPPQKQRRPLLEPTALPVLLGRGALLQPVLPFLGHARGSVGR